MKRTSYFILSAVALLFTVISITSCAKDKTEVLVVLPEDCPDTISFATQVEPMIQANCATSGCHGSGSAAAGYNLEGHTNISTNASDVLTAIKHEGSAVPMPYFQPKLNDSLIDQFDCWIKQGTLNN